jgi:Abnormal spindle-like microcephaly-assoc'd, ASPM-SPD-2-Hydin/Beta-propeller repeat
MKIRSKSVNRMRFMGVATLLCGGLLLTLLGGAGKPSLGGKTGMHANAATKFTQGKQPSQLLQAYGSLPLSFEENIGQTAREVRYVAHGGRYELFLTPQQAVMALRPAGHLDFSPRHRFATLRALREARRNARQTEQMTTLGLQLEGSNPEAQISGVDPLPGRVNYFIGNDRANWHTDVHTFAKVKYAGVYPGIDLIFYGKENSLEYDFIVGQGADPATIALKVTGASKMRIDSRGDVLVSVPSGEVRLQKPLIYQQVNGKRHEVAGNYTIAANHRLTFSVASYDRNQPLVLDPVLDYSTYVGGTADDDAEGIAVDSNGDAFIAGNSASIDFPTTSNAFIPQPLTANTSVAAFVAELNPAGNTLLYSSYIAGSTPGETAFGVAVDPTGKAVYVTGQTLSPDFPTNSTTTGFKTGSNPGATSGTSYLVKFDPTQTTGANSFVYSTFIGGTNGTGPNGDLGLAVAADGSGNAYVTGLTDSSPGTATDLTTFPIVGGFQATLGNSNGGGNAFLAKINTTVGGSSSLISSSYLGGDAVLYPTSSLGYGDAGWGVAIDSSANAYIVGTTTSSNFGTLTTTGLALTYPTGNTSNAAFFAKISTATAGSQSLSYLTYLGGTGPDFGQAIAVGPNNVAYLTGSTSSLNFPLSTGAYQTTGSSAGVAFVALVDTSQPVANSLTNSTFVGGGNGDFGYGIKADAAGNAYVAGGTSSQNFPVTAGALQTTFPTGAFGSGFVLELNPTLSTLLYSSYFGGSGDGSNQDLDYAQGIAINSSTPPNVYIAGQSFSTNLPVAGTPVAPLHAGLNGTASDAYVAELTLTPSLTVAPSPFDFGVVQLSVPTPAQAFVATNNTGSTITFNSIVVTGVSPAANTDFAKSSDDCSPSVAAAATCTVNVTFTPSVAAAESATLVITAVVTNGGLTSTQVFDVNLTGTGSTTVPGIAFNPTSLAFGPQALTTTSAAMPVMLTNPGTGPLTINSITASGDFAQTNNCPSSPTTLPASGTCTINVTFTPTALGARTGTLTFTDNAHGSPQTVPLTGTGTGPSITFSPTSVSFNPQMLTTTSSAMPVKVTNSGTGPLTINSITASGDFAQTNNCPSSPTTLPASGTCTINVTFAPTAVGARTGTLTFAYNAGGSPQTIPLTGTGWDFQVSAPSTATGKSPVTFNATMTPLGGFNQSVAFTCTGAPAGTTCTVVTPITATDGKTAQSVGVTITRMTGSLLLPAPPARTPPISIWQIVPLILASLFLFLLTKAKGLRVRVGLATAVLLLVTLAGCSSSRPPTTGTVTITGTSTGSAGTESHSATVAVTVD